MGRFDINSLFSRGAQGLTRIGADISTGKLSGKTISEGIKQVGSALLHNLRKALGNFPLNLEKLRSRVKDFHPDTIKKTMESVASSVKKSETELQGQLQNMSAVQSPRSHTAPKIRQKTRKEGMQRENFKPLRNTNKSPSPASSERNELRNVLTQLKRDIPPGERRAPSELRELFKRHNEQRKMPQERATFIRSQSAAEKFEQSMEVFTAKSQSRPTKESISNRPTPKAQFRPSADNPESFRIANPSNGGRASRWDKEAVRKEEKHTRILEDSGDPNMSWDDVNQFLDEKAKARNELDATVAQQNAARSLARKQALGNSGANLQAQTRLLARLDKIANELNTKLNPDHPDYDLLADSHDRRQTLEKEQKNIEAKLKELEE